MKEANTECDLYCYGKCAKYDKRETCEKHRSNASWFTDKLERCQIGDVCRQCSIFGNAFYKLTLDNIEALKRGEILFDIEEYGTFIMLETE